MTLWTIGCQVPLSMGLSWQECWSGLPFASPEDLPDPGIEPMSPVLQVDSLPLRIIGAETYARPSALNFQYVRRRSSDLTFGNSPPLNQTLRLRVTQKPVSPIVLSVFLEKTETG